MNTAEEVTLEDRDLAALAGELGEGVKLAMALVVKLAEISRADQLIDISRAHIDGCLYHGQAGVDFAQRMVDSGASVSVPTTLNVSSLDLLHPELYRGDEADAREARRLMDLHVDLGCKPTWTCAPYQLPDRPEPGEQIAWGESNAIVFANSVLGARTNRYGDFADLACAITGRAPHSGLHTDEGRLSTVVVEVDVADELLDEDLLYPLLGHWLGANCGVEIPAIVGLDERADEDRLKALGAAAASSGATAMFHVVGVTPEASTLEEVTRSGVVRRLTVDSDALAMARVQLGWAKGNIGAVSVGTPHMSSAGLTKLATQVHGLRTVVPFYVNTSRSSLAEAGDSALRSIQAFGATIVTDTCTYITPIIGDVSGPVMTDSGKWAYYAPGNLGVGVVIGSLTECITSAVAGEVHVDDRFGA